MPACLRSKILERFAFAQRAEAILVLGDISTDFVGVGPCVLPQRPPDGFAEEKLMRVE